MKPVTIFLAGAALTGAVSLTAAVRSGGLLPTTLADFSQPGTQAGDTMHTLYSGQACAACHGYYNFEQEPYRRWASSLMAQASRDPIFHAALAIAEQDADFAGDLCLRCHAPNGWLAGRASPTDGSGLNDFEDKDGVSCHMCHRMVDPVFEQGNPPVDQGILAALTDPPLSEVGNGQVVIDPEDRRRGPYDLPNCFMHDWLESPFHRDSLLCASCHDVSNPVFERQPDGTDAMGAVDQPHPTDQKTDQFPIERTYGEWSASDYSIQPIETQGRFGGNQNSVQSCQDCHMPKTKGAGALPGLGSFHQDLGQHDFNGANSWVLEAVHRQNPGSLTGLTDGLVEMAIQRNHSMLRRAADFETFQKGSRLVVRVINQTGHKLPTGYGEGRRMWISVQFFDALDELVGEHGAYDQDAATLTLDTQVYEIKHGIGPDVATATGLPTGPSFHFVLNNVIEKDNRIPPKGYDDRIFAALGAPIVGYSYPDEHYWDDVAFPIPAGAVRAEAHLWHQTTSREYIEFLRDTNTTNNAGLVAYQLWESLGKSEPVAMAASALHLDGLTKPAPLRYGLAVRSSSGKKPGISWAGSPVPGGALTIEGSNCPPGARAGLLVGDEALRTPLPNGGWKLVGGSAVTAASAVVDPSGSVSFPVSVPPGSAGTRRYYQILLRDPASVGGIAATPGLFVELAE